MTKIAWIGTVAIGMLLGPSWQAQEKWRQACVDRCYTESAADPELQRQEIFSLEKEAAHALLNGFPGSEHGHGRQECGQQDEK